MQKENKRVNIVLLCTVIYFISYVTRINYGAIIAEMVTSTGYGKSELSMALTGSFITYGLGQIISGYFGDRYQPRLLITLGLLLSVAMNLLIPVCPGKYAMTAVWCVNGFAQSFMWPPLVKLMTSVLSTEEYNRGCVKVSWGSSLGTVFVYFMGPAVIALFNWQSVFVMCALMGIAGLVYWNVKCPSIDLGLTVSKRQINAETSKKSVISVFVVLVMLGIILQGILRDGVTTWMPSYISETYNMSNTLSILTGVIMPVFGIVCSRLAMIVYRKMPTNPVLCAGIFFGVGAGAALGINALSGASAAASVGFTAVLTGCMHGVNLMLICMVPRFFQNTGHVSLVSGLLNSCTYVGSAISTFGVALLTEQVGWKPTIALWAAIALAGTVLCFICVRPWLRQMGTKTKT